MKNLGRKKRQIRCWRSVAILLFIIALIFSFGRLAKLLELKDIHLTQAVSVARAAEKQLDVLEFENQELKEKVERSSKAQVDDRTKDIVKYYIKEYFGPAAPTAEKIFTCESGLSPAAKNVNKGAHAGSVDRGVAQINDKFHKARFEKMYGIPFEIGAHDIQLNLKYAAWLYETQGHFGAWVCSRLVK